MSDHSTNDRLDQLLGAWAAAQRLDERDADRVLRSVLQQPQPTLPATWWTDLSAQVTSAVLLATERSTTSGGVAYGGTAAA